MRLMTGLKIAFTAGFVMLGLSSGSAQAGSLTLGFPTAPMAEAPLRSLSILPDFLGHDGYDPVANALARGWTPETMDARFDCNSGMQARCLSPVDQAAVSLTDSARRATRTGT